MGYFSAASSTLTLLLFLFPLTTCQSNGDVRLVNGQYGWEGRVELYWSGSWGTVCDDSWSDIDAMVVCRQLGYQANGASAECCARYGQGSGSILLDDVSCTGSEATLLSCTNQGIGSHNCGHGEDAAVVCEVLFPCEDESGVRLVSGSGPYDGRVEVCLGGRLGTVCDDGWSTSDALVVCRQLGYDTQGVQSYSSAYFGEGAGPIFLNNVACSTSERKLVDCSYESNTAACGHSDDAGVMCQLSTCQDGDIRLINGVAAYQGRVEVCLGGRWGTVSDDGWSSPDTLVLCRQLGYQTVGFNSYSNAQFGQGTGPILLDNVGCLGTESRLLECSYDNITTEDTHAEDVGVFCAPYPCQDWDVRLAGGNSTDEGRIEVCFSGRWGRVSLNRWSAAEAQVVCRQLGYHTQDVKALPSAHFGEGTGPVLINVICSGTESSLLDCSYSIYTTDDQDNTKDPGVICHACEEGDGALRLAEGNSVYEGLVEVCLGERWGSVCSDGWTAADANVTCRQLGHPSNGFTSNSYTTSHVSGLQLVKHVGCYGSESRLLECSYSTDDAGHGCDDVGVQCIPAFSLTDIQIEMAGEITCSTPFITMWSESIQLAVRDQIVAAVKETCQDCTFTVRHIQDVQLTCCSNRLETLAIQATISSSEDVTLDAILTTIEQWVASKPTLPGGDSVLRLDENNIVNAKCTSPDLEQQQNDEEDSSQTTDNVVIALFVIVIAVVLAAGIAAVIAGIVIWRYLKKKKGSHTLESVQFQDLLNRSGDITAAKGDNTGGYSAPPKPAAGRPKIPKRSKVKAAAGKDQDQNPTHKSDEAENYEEMNTEIIYEVPA